MTQPAFDTLKVFDTLQKNKAFTPEQARAINDAFVEILNTNLVTQTDLFKVESEIKSVIKSDLVRIESEIKSDLLRIESEIKTIKINFDGHFKLLNWMNAFTLTMVSTLVTASIIKFLIQ